MADARSSAEGKRAQTLSHPNLHSQGQGSGTSEVPQAQTNLKEEESSAHNATAPISEGVALSPAPSIGFKVVSFKIEKPCRIKQLLKEDHLFHIFSFLDGYGMAKASSVCHDWDHFGQDHTLWREYCAQLWEEHILSRLEGRFGREWKKTFIKCPHIRFDGVYKLECATWRASENEDHRGKLLKNSYFRYVRFFPNYKVDFALLTVDKHAHDHFQKHNTKHVKAGTWRYISNGVKVVVDLSHIESEMHLTYRTCEVLGANDHMTFAEFYGTSPTNVRPSVLFLLLLRYLSLAFT